MDQSAVKSAVRPGQTSARGHLLRVLGVSFGLTVTIGNTIGAGILRTPGEIAQRIPNVALFTTVWVIGGLYVLLCAFSVAELATLIPRSGGHYVFAHDAFGDYPGFIVGWSDWLSTCSTTALVAMIVAEYTGLLFPSLAGQSRWMAILVVAAFAILQWQGIRWGSGVQQITGVLKAAGFLALIAACFILSHPSAPRGGPTPTPAVPAGLGLLLAIVLSLQSVIYTYDGWQGVIYFSEEVHDPARDITRSMFGGIATVIFIYVVLNLAVLYVIPIAQIAGDPLALGTAVRVMWGNYADAILEVVVIVSMLSAMNAFELMGCRIVYAMSRDKLFPELANQVNEGGTPNSALLMTSAVAIAFIATGTFPKVIAVTAFFFVFNYIVDLLAIMALRRRAPNRPRPYCAWGYPWTTRLALMGSMAFLAGAIVEDTRNSVYAVLVLSASYPLFRLIRARQSRPSNN